MIAGARDSKMLRGLLALILLATLTTGAAFGFVCEPSNGGQCLHWTQHAATLQSFLGSPGQALVNGTSSWDQNAVAAGNDWNSVGADFHFNIGIGGQQADPCGPNGIGNNVCAEPPGINPIYFATSNCGAGFGDAIEVTLTCSSDQTGAMANTAVLVDNNVLWNAYDGNVRFTINGQVVYDIRRVLLHELGHALGLDHPDTHGQQVAAVMNSHVSNLDRLQPDDISGIFSLYGGGPAPPSSGCQIDAHPAAPTGRRLLMPLCLAVLLLGRRASRRRITAREIRPWQ